MKVRQIKNAFHFACCFGDTDDHHLTTNLENAGNWGFGPPGLLELSRGICKNDRLPSCPREKLPTGGEPGA